MNPVKNMRFKGGGIYKKESLPQNGHFLSKIEKYGK